MKKAALILKWLTILFSLRLVYLLFRQIWNVIQSYINGTIEKDVFFGIKMPEDIAHIGYLLTSLVSCIILVYLFYLLNIFRSVVQDLVKNQIFIFENVEQLIKISKGLFIFGMILFLIQLVLRMIQPFPELPIIDSPYSAGYSLGYILGVSFNLLLSTGFPIFIYALFIFIIAKLIKEGHLLKQENELTI